MSRHYSGRAFIVAVALVGLLASRTTAQSVQPAESPIYRLAAGDQLEYQLVYRSQTQTALPGLLNATTMAETGSSTTPPTGAPAAPGQQRTQIEVAGRWIAQTLSDDNGVYFVAWRLADAQARVSVDGQAAEAETARLSAQLSLPVYVTMDAGGAMDAVAVDGQRDPLAYGVVRSILSLWQFVLPPRDAAPGASSTPSAKPHPPLPTHWQTIEDDASGAYRATYSAEDGTGAHDSGATGIHKQHDGYLSSRRPRPGTGDVDLQFATALDLHFDFSAEDGVMAGVAGSRRQRVRLGGKNAGGAVETIELKLNAQFAAGDQDLARWLAQFRAAGDLARADRLSVDPLAAEQLARAYRRELGESTLDELLADLERASVRNDPVLETSLYHKFAALCALQPESNPRLGQILAATPADGPAARILPDALAASGSPAAQAALIWAVRARNDAVAVRIIDALGAAQRPEPETLQTLRKLATEETTAPPVARAARLALGAAAWRLFDDRPDKSAEVVGWLSARLAAASPFEKRDYLLALGNAASARGREAISAYTSDADPSVRGAAVFALRWIDDPRAESLLLERLTSDADERVRLDAARACRYRWPSVAMVQTQQRAFFAETSEPVRLQLLGNLWRLRDDFPAAGDLVLQAAQADPSADVRQAAEGMLRAE